MKADIESASPDPSGNPLLARANAILTRWARRDPALRAHARARHGTVDLTIVFSPRLTRSLARVNLGSGEIKLAPCLAQAPAILEQALCHELAHLVAWRLVGRTEGPHGKTWQRLMREAGHPPARKLAAPPSPLPSPPPEAPTRTPAPRAQAAPSPQSPRRYLHRCLVCQFARLASRRMSAWRCADCVAAGLDGRLALSTCRS